MYVHVKYCKIEDSVLVLLGVPDVAKGHLSLPVGPVYEIDA